MVGIFSACSSEQDDLFENESIVTKQKNSYAFLSDNQEVIEVDSATFYNTGKPATRLSDMDFLPPVAKDAASMNTMQATGYTKKSIVIKATKASYSSSNPILLFVGLPQGIYFTECIKVTKELSSYNAGDMIVPAPASAESKITGLLEAGLYETKVGWTPDEPKESGDKKFYGITYLIHFKYDISGQTIDRYYPCRPEDLVWTYVSLSM